VALDPGFVQAWARVSLVSSLLYASGTPSPALAERARQAGERAVALAPNRPEGHLALGDYERNIAVDNKRALEQFEKGLRVAPGHASLVRATAQAEQALGRWDAAVEHFKHAERLDPRFVSNLASLGEAFLLLRRYPEARQALDRGLALAPANLLLIENKAMTYLAEGDLAGARAALRAAPGEVEPTALVAFVASYQDLVWVLDEEHRELLLRLTPSAFDDVRSTWALCLVQAHALKDDAANVRTYAEEARKSVEEELRAAPNDAQRHTLLGLARAYLGRKEDAVREGERGVVLDPVSKDAYFGPYLQHQLVRIYMLVGEPEKALDQLEPLLKIPYFLSPGWLRIDPNFDPLRKNPRFQKLVAGK
jgi:tetratricopeptide (TPR) repeat protein